MDLGGQNDVFRGPTVTVPMAIAGGEGNDDIVGGAGHDVLTGGDGEDTPHRRRRLR